MYILEKLIALFVPPVISLLELMGILVVTWSGLSAFWEYLQNAFMKKRLNLQFHLANGLATGLEFKMAAEILKTVLVHELSELIILGAVILLRAILSFLIHFEMKHIANGKEGENC